MSSLVFGALSLVNAQYKNVFIIIIISIISIIIIIIITVTIICWVG